MDTISEQDIHQAFKKSQEEFHFPGVELQLLTEDRFPDILDAARRCFLTDESLEKSLQMEWSSDMVELWMPTFRFKLCLNAVDVNSKEIIGFRAIRVTKKSDYVDLKKVKDESVRKLLEFFEYASDRSSLFEKYGINEYFEFFGLGVLPEYRGRGLATLLLQTGLKFLGHLQRPCYLKGSATSNFSKKIYDKFNFETLGEFPFDEYKVDGKVVFDKTGEHKSMIIYAKIIQ